MRLNLNDRSGGCAFNIQLVLDGAEYRAGAVGTSRNLRPILGT